MTQKEKVLKQLRSEGYVSRNWCLSNYISRLSAIILSLKKEGMNIEADFKEGDYVYRLKDKPKEMWKYTTPDGVEIIKKVW